MGFGGQGIRNNTLAFSLSGSEIIDDTAELVDMSELMELIPEPETLV